MHARELALFDDIASALNHTEIDRALHDVLALIVRELDLAAGWMWLLGDRGAGSFYLAAAERLPPYLRSPVEMTGDRCWCMESFADGDFEYTNVDIVACSRLRKGERNQGTAATAGLTSHASVALRFGPHRLGILNVCPSPGARLDDAQLRILSAAGAQIGLAVERARLAEHERDRARTEERARLARDVHDTLAQDLVAIALTLESALRSLGPTQTQTQETLTTALETTRASLERARGSVLSLRDETLGGKSLALSLTELAHAFTSETGIPVTLGIGAYESLDHTIEREAYRIAAEALRNVRHHAHASLVTLTLQREDKRAILCVRDDGAGFTEPPAADRFGLVGMEERARSVGGALRIASSAAGTLVEFSVPLR